MMHVPICGTVNRVVGSGVRYSEHEEEWYSECSLVMNVWASKIVTNALSPTGVGITPTLVMMSSNVPHRDPTQETRNVEFDRCLDFRCVQGAT